MKSEIIYNFYEFLEKEDTNFKNNGAIVDDGFEALYCLLFKLMGDGRTIPELLELMGMPHPAEFELINFSSFAQSPDLILSVNKGTKVSSFFIISGVISRFAPFLSRSQ